MFDTIFLCSTMNPTTNSFIISLVLITKEQPIRGDVLRASPPFAQSIFQAPPKDAETTRNVRNSALCACAYTQSCCEVNTRAKTAKSVPDATTTFFFRVEKSIAARNARLFAQSIFRAPPKDAETTRNVRNSALCACAYTQSCCEVNTRAKTAKSVPDATTATTRVAIHSRIPGTRAGHDARGSCMRFGPTRVRFESKRRALICSSVTAPWREQARRGGAIFHAL